MKEIYRIPSKVVHALNMIGNDSFGHHTNTTSYDMEEGLL